MIFGDELSVDATIIVIFTGGIGLLTYINYVIGKDLSMHFNINDFTSKLLLTYFILNGVYEIIKLILYIRICCHYYFFGPQRRLSCSIDLYGHGKFSNFIHFVGHLIGIAILLLDIIIFGKFLNNRHENYNNSINVISFFFVTYISAIVIIICFWFCFIYSRRINNRNIIIDIYHNRLNAGNYSQENINAILEHLQNYNMNLESAYYQQRNFIRVASQALPISSFVKAKSDNNCPICLENIIDPIIGVCSDKHAFCKECLTIYRASCLRNGNDFICPVCRITWNRKVNRS